MRHSSEILKSAIAAAKETLQSLVELDAQVAKAADLIEQCLYAGNKLLVCGNGGSAADAAHFATELVVRFAKDRRAYPAICLASDGGLLTAAGNDYGFDEIFARQVAAFGMPGDVLICLTTSGKSKNVQRALEEAKARKLKTIAFLHGRCRSFGYGRFNRPDSGSAPAPFARSVRDYRVAASHLTEKAVEPG